MGLIANSDLGHRIFLSVTGGKIRRRTKDGNEEFYKSVEGKFKGISMRESEYNGAPVNFYDFHLVDGNDEFVLSINRASSVARSIVLNLASVKSFAGTTIRISPWLKENNGKQFTNISVYQNNEKLGWVTNELPEVPTVTVGSDVVKDDSKLISFVQQLVDGINLVVNRELASDEPDGLSSELEDMPE